MKEARGAAPGSHASNADAAHPVSPTGGAKHVELTPIHDFASKLRQPEILPRLAEYVRWQAFLRGTLKPTTGAPELRVPEYAPVSINLDITTACNFACDHCVDMHILNTGIKYDHDKLLDSIRLMTQRGLKSVIVIGGGEPTVYPKFSETLRFMKELGLQVSVVSNGSGMHRIAEVASLLDENDWVRLSLDSASDEVFQAMHKPKKKITLDQICAAIPEIKQINPRFPIGFSFIITWKGALINDTNIIENIHEIVAGAERARRFKFDYIAYKPFLTRAVSNNAEIVDLHESNQHFDEIIARIRASVDEAKKLATPEFRVIETTNLKVLENRSFQNYTQQPHECHMQFFRQVLSPLGMYNCPVYRNQPHGRLGGKEAYATDVDFQQIRGKTAELIQSFDATHQCKEVTCLYNHANWWIENLIEHPEELDRLEARGDGPADYFL
ncbi:MAG: radical SAM protein [Planctomycetota bacterium]